MTKSEIKKELRRSACEDSEPYFSVSEDAWMFLYDEWHDFLWLDYNDHRIFFLLVAEAL